MAFTCPRCNRTSHHPDDARFGYCGYCHAFTDVPVAARNAIYLHIDAERARQDIRFPNRTCADPIPAQQKLAVLVEEVGEVARALLEREPPHRLRAELVQVAAVAHRLDRKRGPVTTPVEDHQRWETEVRDPANLAAEPVERLRVGKAEVTVQVAHIPGGWAWRATAEIGSWSYSGAPWCGPLPSREDATWAALDHAERFYRRRHHAGTAKDAERMLAKIQAARERAGWLTLPTERTA